MALKIPHIFTAGTKAKAEEVNDNFSAIESEVNDNLQPALFEPGDIKVTARSAPPTGWLLCDGSAVSRTTYDDLFDAIGTTFGVGDGSTTFNLPDYRGRTLVGVDGSAGRLSGNDALGKSGGEEKHDLSTSEIPSHSHSDGSLSTGSAGDHSHTIGWGTFAMNWEGGGNATTAVQDIGSDSTGINGSHTHPINGDTGSTGGGDPHNNMQPYQVCNILVKV